MNCPRCTSSETKEILIKSFVNKTEIVVYTWECNNCQNQWNEY